MSYRIEVSPNNRAGCQATHCKAEGVKIKKGEIRQGVLVMFDGEHQSMRYRHWGCVTPQVIHNWAETSSGDMELVDGYDTLPDEVKEKVQRALKQGHVDDDEWNGDVECNRYDPDHKNQGMFVKRKTPKKKAKDEDEDAEDAPSPSKKRGRAKKADNNDDDDVKPAPRKRAKKAATVDEEDDEASPPKKSRKSKTPAKDLEADEEQVAPAPKKGRKAKKPADDEDGDEPTAPASKKEASKLSAKVVSDSAEDDDLNAPPKKAALAKKTKKVAAAAAKSDIPVKDEEQETPKAKPTRKGRAKKAAA